MSDEFVQTMILVARMYYLDGLDQQEIADIVGTSRSRVSRMLTSARERGFVRISVDHYEPRDSDLEQALVGQYGLKRAVVVRTFAQQPEHVRRAVGYFGAPAVADLIHSGASIGMAGGRTLRELIHHLQPAERTTTMTIVQLMGNIGPMPDQIDALELSRSLAQRVAGTFYTLNAPVLAQSAEARELLMSHDHIRVITSLFSNLDVAFVGIGTLQDSAFIERGVLTRDDASHLKAQGAVGEICGRFFDRDGQESDTVFRDRVISIALDDLRSRPEIVAITNGSHRGEAIRAAIRGHLITSLVIDESGARELLGNRAGGSSPAGR
ncbi:MAG: sugar-binding transcriptional regulator [Thermomicrobiales bacterium]